MDWLRTMGSLVIGYTVALPWACYHRLVNQSTTLHHHDHKGSLCWDTLVHNSLSESWQNGLQEQNCLCRIPFAWLLCCMYSTPINISSFWIVAINLVKCCSVQLISIYSFYFYEYCILRVKKCSASLGCTGAHGSVKRRLTSNRLN